MRNAVKKQAENSVGQTQTAVMTVLKVVETVEEEKIESQEEKPDQKDEPKIVSIVDVIKKVNEQFYLTEQHANLTNQINKLNNFRSRINTNTSLMLTNGGGDPSFNSNDPAAVETLISICIGNIQDRINAIESKLLAA